MEQNLSYVRISELIKMAKPDATTRARRCDRVLGLIEQTFLSIDEMTIEEREDLMRHLTGWLLVEKFEAKGHSAVAGLERYCIADCLFDDPTWSPPKDIVAPKLLSGPY